MLRSVHRKRVDYVGVCLPDPIQTPIDEGADDAGRDVVEKHESGEPSVRCESHVCCHSPALVRSQPAKRFFALANRTIGRESADIC